MKEQPIWTGTEWPALASVALACFCATAPVHPNVFAFGCFACGWCLGLCYVARRSEKEDRRALSEQEKTE
jgi:heterodisulfide reductase subunit C